MERSCIEIIGATIGYGTSGGRVVAKDINATLHGGELVSLIGRNGCGKSTLFKTLTGFLPLLEGQILLDGKGIEDYSIQQRARHLSMVTTNARPAHDMTVFELAALGRSPYTGFWGTLGSNDREIVAESLRKVGMEKYMDRMAATLSDGELQKVMIARAIAQETPTIILDEPTSFLDYPSKVQTMQLLSRLAHESGRAVLLSTHDLEQALRFSDRIWLIDSTCANGTDNRPEAQIGAMLVRSPQEMIEERTLENLFGFNFVELK